MLYSDKVLDHFSNPRNVGEIPDADGVGEVGNAKCGDIMKMYLKINGGIIEDVKFKTFGCGAAIATSSMATEMVKGHTIEDALSLTNKMCIRDRRSSCDWMLASLERTRITSCSRLISSEKMATGFLARAATLVAMFSAKAVLPIAGRAASRLRSALLLSLIHI